MKWLVSALLIVAVAIACVLVFAQSPFAASAFEYGQFRDYTGALETWPYPMLVTDDRRYLLVAPGKHGIALSPGPGDCIHVKASLIHRDSTEMLEASGVSRQACAPNPQPRMTLGPIVLTGEIVDSKCYLGVMNPGNGKVHRDCAARCISGGVPPAFIAKDSSGNTQTLLLTGIPKSELLAHVAEPVHLSGELISIGSTLVFKARLE